MEIQPIKPISYGNSYKVQNSRNNTTSEPQIQISPNLVKVPIALMMFLAPINVSSKNYEINNETLALSESTSKHQISNNKTISYEKAQNINEQKVLPTYMQPENILFEKSFTYENKTYTMLFSKAAKSESNTVVSISFIPEDYVQISKNGQIKNSPPLMRFFVYHNIYNDKSKNYYTAETVEKSDQETDSNSKFSMRKIKLPNEIANDIVRLMNGTKLSNGKILEVNETMRQKCRIVTTP